MYSVEQQALAQLVSAPDLAGDPGLAAEFRRHYAETEQQAELIEQRLEAAGGTPSTIKNLIMKAGGKGFLLFAQMMPETPGRLVAHAYAYEAMEWAGYEMLIRFAEHAGDAATVDVARRIRDEERQMMNRLERGFDAAEAASHGATALREMGDHVLRHLNEAHALESQAEHLLGKSKEIAVSEALAQTCATNLEAAREHGVLLETRLKTLGSSPSDIKDTALGLGGLNWGMFFQAQADTPAKLAAFVYAFEHLKIAGYQLLKRTADRAGDSTTVRLCDEMLEDEHMMVEDLASTFDSAVEASLAVLK
jgi:ferritin-like metal-binding protein YciE